MSTPTLKTDIRTRHIIAFETAYNAQETPTGRLTIAAAVVRSAAVGGWFENGFVPDDVDDLTPRETIALQNAINDLYGEAITIPPN